MSRKAQTHRVVSKGHRAISSERIINGRPWRHCLHCHSFTPVDGNWNPASRYECRNCTNIRQDAGPRSVQDFSCGAANMLADLLGYPAGGAAS